MQFTPLTIEQRQRFEDDGFLIVRGALDAAMVARLTAAGDRLCDSDLQENRQLTADGLYDGFRNCIALDDAYLPLLTHSATVPLLVQLLGPNLHLVTTHLIHKHPDPADTPRNFRSPGWHRDVGTLCEDLGHAHVPRLEMKIAYYLTDLTEPGSGSTLFAPGSHKLKDALAIDASTGNPANAVEPSLQAGDAVLFENRTWHAAGGNFSGRTRKAVMFGYGYLWVKPFDYILPDERLGAMTDDIGRQFLGCLKSPDGRFIPGGISTPLKNWCAQHGVVHSP